MISKLLAVVAVMVTLAAAPAAQAQAPAPGLHELALRSAAAFIQAMDLDRLADQAFSATTSDYPDNPACADLQKRSIKTEIAGDHEIFVQVFAAGFERGFTADELAAGASFLESQAGRELIGYAFAKAKGQENVSLSPQAIETIRTLSKQPEFMSFASKLSSGLDPARLKQDLEGAIYPRWKRRFADMAKAEGVSCPTRDWKN
jgi:hypothetical protein